MADPPGPVLGPCTSWCDASDIAGCGIPLDCEGPPLLDDVAVEASMVLYEISGRQFTGLCERKVRPCRDACSCFGISGGGPWTWSLYPLWSGGGFGWGWRNECGDRCGCQSTSSVLLSGYPVREITEVKIDGVALDPTKPAERYRLERWRYLVRLADPGPPVVNHSWPACQDLRLDDDQSGTFSVSYLSGVMPPPIARRAAAQLAAQLFLACNGEECALPAGVTKVVRQGIEVDRSLLADWFTPGKPTGLVALDSFLVSYWRSRGRRRPAVWSPDGPRYARRVAV